jgi:hypothetical protein
MCANDVVGLGKPVLRTGVSLKQELFVLYRKCDRLWENLGKVASQNSEKKQFFLVMMPL